MRIRTVKPEFWSHPVMGKLKDTTKLLAIGLLNYADDEGYFYADPSLIRSALRPFDDESTMIRRSIDELSRTGYLALCEHPTHGALGVIVAFAKHQRIDRPKASIIKPLYDSTTNRRIIDDQSLLEQGTGNREGNGVPPNPPPGGFAPSVVASESETKALAKAQRLGKARPALHYLNEKSGRRYSESESNLTLIAARMEEVEWDFVGVKQMVDRQVEKWRGTSMEDYLRPTTLFNKTKFDGYWAARCEPILNGDKPSKPDRGDRILAQLNKMKV